MTPSEREAADLADLLRRIEELRRRGKTLLSAEEGLAALKEFNRTGDTRLIRVLIEEAEKAAVLFHSRECGCGICKARRKADDDQRTSN